MFKKLLGLCAITLFLSACKQPFIGELNINAKMFAVKSSSGQVVTIPQGKLAADVRFKQKSSGEGVIIAKLPSDIESSFKIKMGILHPEENETGTAYFIKAADSGQSFDMKAELLKPSIKSEIVEVIEECSPFEGYIHPIPYHGSHLVRYNKITTTRDLSVSFTRGQQELAKFTGVQTHDDYEYVSSTQCGMFVD